MENEFSWVGSRYLATKNMMIKDITAQIRQYARRNFPGLKFSVVKKDAGRSYEIAITFFVDADSPQFKWDFSPDFSVFSFSPFVENALRAVWAFAQSYNYEDYDPFTDYHAQRFFLTFQTAV